MLEMEYSDVGDQYRVCWCPGSLSRQSISRHGKYIRCTGQTSFGVPGVISSTLVKPNPIYDSKCEHIFCNLSSDSPCNNSNVRNSNVSFRLIVTIWLFRKIKTRYWLLSINHRRPPKVLDHKTYCDRITLNINSSHLFNISFITVHHTGTG